MFKSLLKKQLLEALAAFPFRHGKGVLPALLFAAALLAIMLLSFGTMAAPLCLVLAPRGFGWLYFDIMGFTALAVGTAAAAFVSYSTLFCAKDNELLLSLPIPSARILAARMLSVFISCVCYQLMVLAPAEAVWLYYSPCDYAPLLCAAPFTAALGCVGTVLACLAGWAAAAISERVKSKSAAAAVVTVLFIAIYAAGFKLLQAKLSLLLDEALSSPEALHKASGVPYWFGKAACGNAVPLMIVLLLSVCLLAAFLALLSPFYFKIIMSRPAARPAAKAARIRTHSVHAALFLREAQRFCSSAAYLVNGAFGWLLAGAVIVAALLRPETLRGALLQMPQEIVLPLLCVCLCAASGTVPVAAPSVSLEGRSLWLAQSLPVTSWQILRAKLELHVAVTLPPALACSICVLALGKFEAVKVLACLLAVTAYAFMTARIGLCLGLLMPNFSWNNEAAVIKRSSASILSALCGMAAALAFGVLAVRLTAELNNVAAALFICAAAFAAAAAVLEQWLRICGVKIFSRL